MEDPKGEEQKPVAGGDYSSSASGPSANEIATDLGKGWDSRTNQLKAKVGEGTVRRKPLLSLKHKLTYIQNRDELHRTLAGKFNFSAAVPAAEIKLGMDATRQSNSKKESTFLVLEYEFIEHEDVLDNTRMLTVAQTLIEQNYSNFARAFGDQCVIGAQCGKKLIVVMEMRDDYKEDVSTIKSNIEAKVAGIAGVQAEGTASKNKVKEYKFRNIEIEANGVKIDSSSISDTQTLFVALSTINASAENRVVIKHTFSSHLVVFPHVSAVFKLEDFSQEANYLLDRVNNYVRELKAAIFKLAKIIKDPSKYGIIHEKETSSLRDFKNDLSELKLFIEKVGTDIAADIQSLTLPKIEEYKAKVKGVEEKFKPMSEKLLAYSTRKRTIVALRYDSMIHGKNTKDVVKLCT